MPVASRPLTRAEVAEVVQRIRQLLLADPDGRLTVRARVGQTIDLRAHAVSAEHLAESR